MSQYLISHHCGRRTNAKTVTTETQVINPSSLEGLTQRQNQPGSGERRSVTENKQWARCGRANSYRYANIDATGHSDSPVAPRYRSFLLCLRCTARCEGDICESTATSSGESLSCENVRRPHARDR